MKKTLALAVGSALALPALAHAQTPVIIEKHVLHAHDFLADAAAAKAGAEAHRLWAEDFAGSLAPMIGSRMAASKPVKGAPYSADVTTENNQTLADGNVTAKKTTGRVYRDGEGRTRQETVVNGVARSIQIADPVEGKSVMLLCVSALGANIDASRQKTALSGIHLWPLGTPAKHAKISGAGVPARRFW